MKLQWQNYLKKLTTKMNGVNEISINEIRTAVRSMKSGKTDELTYTCRYIRYFEISAAGFYSASFIVYV